MLTATFVCLQRRALYPVGSTYGFSLHTTTLLSRVLRLFHIYQVKKGDTVCELAHLEAVRSALVGHAGARYLLPLMHAVARVVSY